ncbi:MAG: hypothetical protein QNL88_00125 [Acidobacteriota bacterium]|nr:hypothetical protein [Acidobacteriota bacterium]
MARLVDAQQTDSPAPVIPGLFALGMTEPGVSDGTVNDVRIPLGLTIIPVEDRSWGLRLRLIVYAGIYDLNFDNVVDLDLRFQSLAATPGVEFLVPVGKGWTLKPFTEIGYAHDFDQNIDFGVWSVGMRTLTEWQHRRVAIRLGTKVQFLSTFKSDLELSDEFYELQLGLDVGFPLGLNISGSEAYLSPYGFRRQYIDASIERPQGEPIDFTYTNELGLAFGTRPKIKLWFISLPRIGIGYRWGPELTGWRLSFGFPF